MVDALLIVFSVGVLVALARRPRPVHPATALLLALLAGVFLWANLRPTGWQEVWQERTPEGLDPVTTAMFWRGWPLCPCVACEIHGMSFRPKGTEGFVLLLDGLIAVAVLFLAKTACERCLRAAAFRCDAAGSEPRP